MLAMQARPYFINTFLRHRLLQSQNIKKYVDMYEVSKDNKILETLKDYFISCDYYTEADRDMALADVLAFGKDLLKYRHFEDKQGQDGLDGMDVLSDKNNSTEEKTVYEKGYDLPVDKQEDKTAKKELHEMMQAVWPIYDKSEKGDTSNVVLPSKTIKKILDKIERCSVPAFFSGREEHMRNADKFDGFLKNAQKGEKDSIIVYEVHEDGGVGRNKYTFDGQNMYVLYVGSVWNNDEDVISIDTTYTRIKEWNYTKDGWFTGEFCVPEPPERSETVDGRFRILV